MTSASSPTSDIHESQSSETSASSISVADRVAAVETEASTVIQQTIAAPIDTSGSSASPTNQAAAGEVEGSAVTDQAVTDEAATAHAVEPSISRVKQEDEEIPTLHFYLDVMAWKQPPNRGSSKEVKGFVPVIGSWSTDTFAKRSQFFACGDLGDNWGNVGEQIDSVDQVDDTVQLQLAANAGKGPSFGTRQVTFQKLQELTLEFLKDLMSHESVKVNVEVGTTEEWEKVASRLVERFYKGQRPERHSEDSDQGPFAPSPDGYLIGLSSASPGDIPEKASLELIKGKVAIPKVPDDADQSNTGEYFRDALTYLSRHYADFVA